MRIISKIYGVFLLLGLIGTACVLTGCGRESGRELMERAAVEASSGNWREVLSLTGRAADADPGDPSAWVLKSVAAERCGEMQTAADSARRGAELCATSFLAQYNAGRVLASRENGAIAALPYLERAYALRPDDSDCVALLVCVYAQLNRPETLNYYNHLGQIAPGQAASAEVLSTVGVYLLGAGNVDNAQQFFVAAYNLDNANPRLVLNLARSFDFYLRRPSDAVSFYQYYLTLTERNPEAAPLRTEVDARFKELTRGNR